MSDSAPASPARQDNGNVTGLLLSWSRGDPSALERLAPGIYEDLLRLARARLKREYRRMHAAANGPSPRILPALGRSDQTSM